MPSPVPRGSRPPAPPGAGDETSELQRRPAGPGRPRAPGRLESSFSVEAILARPARRATPAVAPMSGVAADLGSAPSRFPATWLPAYLSVSLYQPCPQLPRTGLRVAHLYGLQGLGVTGLELAHCSGLWGIPDWAPAEELQDTERPQKRVRTMFNLKQLEELEKVFTKQHNLVGKKRAQLAAQLNLTENQVGAGTPVGSGLCLGADTALQKALGEVEGKTWAFFLCARSLRETGPNHWHASYMNEESSPV
ncbi:homeobox protein notochord isoform X1 [Leopardus geoffroyi]|uniref:homeobox protein notochord isoform X1 n=1 Tax=Leopardus geoffroyi TaxID=46844 RepID=UPI001E2600FF|nr:homeobox protein notochord isoform X1 [Leopardus geoffroyi]